MLECVCLFEPVFHSGLGSRDLLIPYIKTGLHFVHSAAAATVCLLCKW